MKFKEKILKEEVEKGKGAALAKCSDHSDDSNESESEYPMCATVTLTARKPTATKRANKATLSHCLSKEELGPCIDSGAQVTVTKKGRLVVRYKGKIIYLKPVSGSPTASRTAEISFPTATEDGCFWSINVLNGGVHATEAAEDLLSLALLLKAGYRIELAVGTEHDPTFGGYLTTPCGKRIKLLFVDNLWRLPVWSQPKKAVKLSVEKKEETVISSNPYAALQEDVADSPGGQPSETASVNRVWTTPAKLTKEKKMEMVHAAWAHPDKTTFLKIHDAYRDDPAVSFPQSFRQELEYFHCPICQLCKGHRPCRHTTTYKNKVAKKVELGKGKHKKLEQLADESRYGKLEDAGPPSPEQFYQKVSEYAAELGLTDLWTQYRLDDPDNSELHIDFAHAIAVGRQGDRYYLVLVFGKNIVHWATPTKTRQEPEKLIQDFIDMTGARVRTVRYDEAAEFGKSSSFRAWAQQNHIVLHPVQAYTHTLNARAENAVKITKAHVRCLLTYAAVPKTFWPYAVAHFCRIYGYWPKQAGRSTWELMPQHRVYLDKQRDLQSVFGMYITGHLPRTHPDVAVDTTNAPRAEEGAFLGFDVATPTAWMYSFRKRKVLRIEVKKFSQHLLPFKNPECLVFPTHYHDARRLDPLLPQGPQSAPTRVSSRPSQGERSASAERNQ